MAYPTYVGAGSASEFTTGNGTPGLPAGWQADDYALLFIETDDELRAAPTGWTEIAAPELSASTKLQVMERRLQGGDSGPTITGGVNHGYAVILAWRGVDSTNPKTVGTDLSGADASVEISSLTTLYAEALVLMCVGHGRDIATATMSGHTNANLANITEHHDAGTTLGNGGGVGVAQGEKATAGATGQSTVTLSAATAWASVHIALYPTQAAASTWVPRAILL